MKNKFKYRKYKGLLRLRDTFKESIRLVNFKRTKWIFLKKNYLKKFIFKKKAKKFTKVKKKLPFYTQSGYHIPSRWERLRFNYAESLLAKLRLFYFFSLKNRVHSLKQEFQNVNSIEKFLLQIEYRLDVLLWRAGFFPSPAVARFFINHKNISINGKPVNLTNTILKGGEIVTISEKIRNLIETRYLKVRSTPNSYYLFVNRYLKRNYKGKKKKLYKKFYAKWEKIKYSAFYDKGPLFVFPFYLEINWDLLSFLLVRSSRKEDLSKLGYIYNTNLDLPALRNYMWRL
jgi:ribosomal protein S4